MTILRINAVSDGPHVLVTVGGHDEAKLYADIETFLTWLRRTHTRVLDAGGTLEITTARYPGAVQVADADVALRAEIGSSCGECLTA